MRKLAAAAAFLLFGSRLLAVDQRLRLFQDIRAGAPGASLGDMTYWDPSINGGFGGWKKIVHGSAGDCLVMGASVPAFGACGGSILSVTAHDVVIGEGGSPFAGVALGANVPLLGTSSADPHASTAFTLTDSTATLNITQPSAGNPGNLNFVDTNGTTANLKRNTTADKVSLTNYTRSAYADAYSILFAGPASGKYYSMGAQNTLAFDGLSNMTVAVAITPTSFPTGSNRCVVMSANLGEWEIIYDGSGNVSFGVKYPIAFNVVTGGALVLNQKNLIIVRVRSSDSKQCLWVNNVAATCASSGQISNSTGTTSIGGGAVTSGFGLLSGVPVGGTIDDIVGWNTALSDTDVGNLWNGGSLEAPASWPAGITWRLRMDDTSNAAIAEDLIPLSISQGGSGTAPTVLQANIWPATVGQFATNRNVISQDDGGTTPGVATTKIGDSNTGLSVQSFADQFNALLANGTIKLIADTNGVEATALYLGSGSSTTVDGVTHYNVNTSDARVYAVAAGGGLTSSVSGSTETIAHAAQTLSGCGDATHSCGLTFDGYGHVTGESNNAIVGAGGTTNYYGSGVPIGSCTGTGSSSTCAITLAAGAYQDLRVVWSGAQDSATANAEMYVKVNSDGTAANYDTGTTVQSVNGTVGSPNNASTTSGCDVGFVPGNSANASGGGFIEFPGYTGSSLRKDIIGVTHGTGAATTARAISTRGCTWLSSSAITSLTFATSAGNFKTTTTFTAYASGGTAGALVGIGGVNGSQQTQVENHESLTLSGATTDTAGNLLPAASIVETVSYRITTTIIGTGVTGFQIGDASTATRFCGTQSTLTAGTTGTCLAHIGTTGQQQAAAAKVRVTGVGGSFSGGVIEIQTYEKTSTPPTS